MTTLLPNESRCRGKEPYVLPRCALRDKCLRHLQIATDNAAGTSYPIANYLCGIGNDAFISRAPREIEQ